MDQAEPFIAGPARALDRHCGSARAAAPAVVDDDDVTSRARLDRTQIRRQNGSCSWSNRRGRP